MKLCFLIFHNSKRINKKMMKGAHNVRRIKRHFLRGISRGQTKAGKKTGHQKAIARYCEEEKRLRKLLNTEQIKLLEHFQDNNSLLEQMEIEHSFRFGYRIGAQMTAELQKAMDSPIE